jgi:hypothetical protein
VLSDLPSKKSLHHASGNNLEQMESLAALPDFDQPGRLRSQIKNALKARDEPEYNGLRKMRHQMPLENPASTSFEIRLAGYFRLSLKFIAGAILAALLAGSAWGQESRLPVNTKGTTDIEILGGGAIGAIGHTPGLDYDAWLAGGRIGRVLTDPHGPGFLRGNLQYSFGAYPVFVFTQPRYVYGGAFDAFVLRWNFHGGRRLAPYAELSGGAVVASHDVPTPNTSYFNFVAKSMMGAQMAVGRRSSMDLSVGYWHLSNANLGVHNPSLNGIHFLVGFHWYKLGHRHP